MYEFCVLGTKSRCREARGHHMDHCALIHFVRIMRRHTMPTPGDCSNLDYASPVSPVSAVAALRRFASARAAR